MAIQYPQKPCSHFLSLYVMKCIVDETCTMTVMTTVTLASCLTAAAVVRLMYVCTSYQEVQQLQLGLNISKDVDLCEYKLRCCLPPDLEFIAE